MNDNQEMVDGYGVSFTPHTQMFHLQAIRNALEDYERTKSITVLPTTQPEWKEKPAGHYEKGSGI